MFEEYEKYVVVNGSVVCIIKNIILSFETKDFYVSLFHQK